MTLKEKRLQILSLAMDINEKYGAVCFFDYSAHTDAIYVRILGKPWEQGVSSKTYTAYAGDSLVNGNDVMTHDGIIDMLQDILQNGIKK